jgi:hypothetical protein
MATATVYTIKDGEVVEQFDCDYNYSIGAYYGKTNLKGTYYIARKGVKIPYPHRQKALKNVINRKKQDQTSE